MPVCYSGDNNDSDCEDPAILHMKSGWFGVILTLQMDIVPSVSAADIDSGPVMDFLGPPYCQGPTGMEDSLPPVTENSTREKVFFCY